jgi:broad specificity phosphatase PhoE
MLEQVPVYTHGRLDMPLEELGRSQARELGDWLAARACGTAPILDELFVELDTGIFMGLSFEQSREKHAETFADSQGRSREKCPVVTAEHVRRASIELL